MRSPSRASLTCSRPLLYTWILQQSFVTGNLTSDKGLVNVGLRLREIEGEFSLQTPRLSGLSPSTSPRPVGLSEAEAEHGRGRGGVPCRSLGDNQGSKFSRGGLRASYYIR